MITIPAGNTVRSTVQFEPEAGSVLIADVSCRYLSPRGVSTPLTVVAGSVDEFYADAQVADDETSGMGVFRWECSAPKISLEDTSTTFRITASTFASP